MNTKPVLRNLVSWLDSQLSMSAHISKLCSSVFFHLHIKHQSYRAFSHDVTAAMLVFQTNPV